MAWSGALLSVAPLTPIVKPAFFQNSSLLPLEVLPKRDHYTCSIRVIGEGLSLCKKS